jgi:N-acetylmuramoyl-L-alanine amidase
MSSTLPPLPPAAFATQTGIDRGTYIADTSHHAQGVDSRIRFLVMHYTEVSEAESLRLLNAGNVSAHYVVPDVPPLRNGKPVVWQLVLEAQRAWHAGASYWQGATELNASSIGIENVNLGPADTPAPGAVWPWPRCWHPWPAAQVAVIIALAQDIVQRYQIAPTRVVAHSDIAPQRKIDPGPLFPWKELYQAGVGAWPDDATVQRYLAGRDPSSRVDVRALQQKLARYGYDVATDGVFDQRTRRVIAAFQMHFRPRDYQGNPDAQTDAMVCALLEKYLPGKMNAANTTTATTAMNAMNQKTIEKDAP